MSNALSTCVRMPRTSLIQSVCLFVCASLRGDLESFEVLGGHKVRYEAMPVSELLEKAFAYRYFKTPEP
jgi:hypothetical protein